VLKLLLLRIGARLILDWTAWASIALALVLAHSALRHLDPDAALLAFYAGAAGSARLTYVVGVLQFALALALLWPRTRVAACAALAAAIVLALAGRLAGGRGDEPLGPALFVLAAALAIALGQQARARRQAAGMRT
jgi:hypothetical protein